MPRSGRRELSSNNTDMKPPDQRESRQKEISIEPLLTEDLPSIIELQHDAEMTAWTPEGFEKELASPFSIMLIAVKKMSTSRRAVGFLSGRILVDELEIHDLVVSFDSRRQGIGAALLAEAVRQAKELGALRAILEVRASNITAISFYKSFGFQVIGSRKAYYQIPVEDALLMASELS